MNVLTLSTISLLLLLPLAGSEAPTVRLTTDKPEYAWLDAAHGPRPRVCITIHNDHPTEPIFFPYDPAWTITDDQGHETMHPLRWNTIQVLAAGASSTSCVDMHTSERHDEAARHDAQWLALSQATLAPPGTYTVTWPYHDLDGEAGTIATTFRLTQDGFL